MNFFLPLNILATVFIEVFFPEPKLYILFIHLLLITLIHAFVISSTWIKSLVCFPSPTIVNGLLFFVCDKKLPMTALYCPEILSLGPYTLKNLKEIYLAF